ncbi:class I SAM-dependent DNA methyltransferase [Candidatus Albibeggiatoa sp. nov. BB20]|uniref:HsdM family class I SAM-dependent methyltransferase n=1 Tax=Candidatus Albibeggiatoa sp. nov. BB20 TaxID=3162723 RepID=UPI00336542FB
MTTFDFQQQCKALIDDLKGICAAYGLGNDGNEFKIITQVFLYKFLHDKFAFEVKKARPEIAENWAQNLCELDAEALDFLQYELPPNTAILKPSHFISHLFNQHKNAKFATLFDDSLLEIATLNSALFSVQTEGGAKVVLFDRVSEYVTDGSKRDDFCGAIINKLVKLSFEPIFEQKYDFYATLFEYLIKDYNKDSGGKYAEYYTPHAVARIMAAILVPTDKQLSSMTCYDPSAGSGTLLMNIAHAIGEERCTLYSQDISQKSSHLLRLNLILNNLVLSIPNIIQGNTLLHPFHRGKKGALQQFDFIVSNPPFKMDFSDFRESLDTDDNRARFFAGLPNIPKAAKDKMAIYQLFLQHILFCLKPNGKAAVVVPTGFITAQSGIDKKIRQALVDGQMLAGVVSMPSNIFATTGTNVSILFIDKGKRGDVVLVDASSLGKKVKEGKNQKTVLSADEETRIVEVFNQQRAEDDFSVVVSYEEIQAKNYSLSAGQYFEVKIEYVDITHDEFEAKMQGFTQNLTQFFAESKELETDILQQLKGLGYEK